MDDVAVRVNKVSKSFKLPHEKHHSVKSLFINVFRGRRTYEKQEVLKNISFEIKKGDFFGIVGRNGSGKSTLLKLMAGIYSPNEGMIEVNGRLTPFIELGVGFNPELTGRENVFLNGALLGFDRKEMESMYDEIVQFAELERFMDQKLKNYSSGMQVRLAFAIAIQANSEILLLDEVLAVGDEAFQRKCYEYFANLKRRKKTVILVSHDMGIIRDYCTKALLIDKGEIVETSSVQEVVNNYSILNLKLTSKEKTSKSRGKLLDTGTGEASIEKTWTSKDGKSSDIFYPNDTIEVNLKIKSKTDIENPVVGISIQDNQGRVVFATNTKEAGYKIQSLTKNKPAVITFEVENIFTNGSYSVSSAVADYERAKVYSRIESLHQFNSGGWPATMQHSLVHPNYKVYLNK